MNIAIPSVAIPVFHDIAQCLESIKSIIGITPVLWNADHKSIIDMFDETRPDIVLFHETHLDNAFPIICQDFDFKYILVAQNPYDSLPKEPEAIITLSELKKHFPTHSNVKEMREYARLAQIHGAQYTESLQSEVLVCTGGYEVNNDILEILNLLTSLYNTKIIGDQSVPLHHYLGTVDMFERSNFIKSTQVVVDMYGNNFWDSSYLKAAPVCMQNSPSHALNFDTLPLLKDHIDSLLKDSEKRKEYNNLCYEKVKEDNTSYNFVSELFKSIKEEEIGKALESFATNIFNEENKK